MTKYPDISIDIESLGTAYDAPILSIGAVAFDRDTGKLGPTFYKEVELNSCIAAGRVNGDTMSWWMRLPDDVRLKMFSEDQSHKLPLSTACFALSNFIRDNCSDVRPWGNGATFDVTILEHAYQVGCVGQKAPWRYVQVRDVRTIVDAAELLAGFDRKTVKRVGTHHNAVDDAVYQAGLVSAAWAALRGVKSVAKVAQKEVVTVAPDEAW